MFYTQKYKLSSLIKRLKQKKQVNVALILGGVLAFTNWVGTAQATSLKLMLNGHDPVSYFSTGGPVRGLDSITYKHDGRIYAFSTKRNAAKFRTNPKKFAPQFGGNCAFGMVFGAKSSIDPNVWKIVDGKIYFHINAGTQRAWLKKTNSYIKRAETAWQILK